MGTTRYLRHRTARRARALGLVFGAASMAAVVCASSSIAAASTSTANASPKLNLKTAPPYAGLPKPSESTALHAKLPAALKKSGKLVEGMTATYAPDEFLAPNGKTVIGMDADFGIALADVLGLKAAEVSTTFDTIIPGLQSGKYDLGNSSFTDTAAREHQVNFVDYFSSGMAIYKPSNAKGTYNSVASLCGHSVAAESGTTELTAAQKQAKKCHMTVQSFPTQTAANLAIASGRAQLGFADSQISAYIAATSNGQFKLAGKAFASAPYGFACPKGPLDAAVLGALHTLVHDGIYAKILHKWGTQSGAIPLSRMKINGATH